MKHLEELIHAHLDGGIAPEQLRDLEELLRNDWEARRLYLELADLDARLLRDPALNTGRIEAVEGAPPARRREGRSVLWGGLTAAAACVLLLVMRDRPVTEAETVAEGCAILSRVLDAEFGGSAHRGGDALSPGLFQLEAGLAQIEFFSGATLLLEGGTELRILSAWEAECLRGRVRVQVPPAAQGFLLHAPGVKLEDLGTEFALNVADEGSSVHVFEGEVVTHRESVPPRNLRDGEGFSTRAAMPPDAATFLPATDLRDLVGRRDRRRFEEWQEGSLERRRDPRLVACYLFHRSGEPGRDRLVANAAVPERRQRSGGAVGASWTEGRWPGKDALEFKRPGDRVRLNLDGSYGALTFACWVKVDAVDKKYNSLLLTDGYESGEPHWQIHEDGSLMFSIRYLPEEAAKGAEHNQMYFSRPVFTSDSLGRWHHLAVSYDGEGGEVVQYFDGAEVGRGVSPLHRPGRGVVFGPCEIGNWGLPTAGHRFPVRNLNGAIDEFAIYDAVLPPSEIAELHRQGRPD